MDGFLIFCLICWFAIAIQAKEANDVTAIMRKLPGRPTFPIYSSAMYVLEPKMSGEDVITALRDVASFCDKLRAKESVFNQCLFSSTALSKADGDKLFRMPFWLCHNCKHYSSTSLSMGSDVDQIRWMDQWRGFKCVAADKVPDSKLDCDVAMCYPWIVSRDGVEKAPTLYPDLVPCLREGYNTFKEPGFVYKPKIE